MKMLLRGRRAQVMFHAAFALGLLLAPVVNANDKEAAQEALERATGFLRSISTNGGYAGIYSSDLKRRYGEAIYEKAQPTQIWVQPPGTPTVGEVFLRAHRVTGDKRYLDAARDTGRALAWGQRRQGGWDHRVDVAHLKPDATRPERKSGHCSFDDDISQGAVTFLMKLDGVLDEAWLTESIELALKFMRDAQFANGAWPQWYPLRGGYHDYYTFNDNAINDCIRVMVEAHRRYGKDEDLASAKRGGDFIIASQVAAPQSGWAQQYSHDMKPAWARSFEPPGVCSAATSRNIRTLIDLYLYTGDQKYLKPIPAAIDWLERSALDPKVVSKKEVGGLAGKHVGVWARLYEVGTNKPVYGDRMSKRQVFYDINKISDKERNSYGWQGEMGVCGAIAYYEQVKAKGRDQILAERKKRSRADTVSRKREAQTLEPAVRKVIAALDERGCWTSGDMIRIHTFVRNMNLLCRYLESLAK
jgi:PelA/Pel-15E family pectate lyase